MLIGIDARMYGPARGGLGRYVEQLIKHLERTDHVNHYAIFLRRDNFDIYQPQNSNFKKVLADIPWYGLAEQTKLPQIIRRQKIDLIHFPHWNVPLFYRGPFVVTIHDLILLHYPTRRASTKGFFTYWFKNFAWRLVLKHAVKKSIKIIAPSEFTKQDIIKTLNVPADKIVVTPLAPLPKSEILNHKSEIINKYGITKPYILYVGVAYPHKNLETLLDAWKIFEEKYGRNYQLVLAGKKNYFYERLMCHCEESRRDDEAIPSQPRDCFGLRPRNDNVIFTGFVSDSDLPALYQNASLYVFPSFCEGFGLPPLEAMSYNLPVASSSASCLPEILKDAAIFFNPQDKKAMAKALNLGLNDQNLRQKLLQNSQKLLKTYSWDKTAEKTLNIYQNSV